MKIYPLSHMIRIQRVNRIRSPWLMHIGDEVAKLEAEIRDLRFLTASSYHLLKKTSYKKNELGAEAQIWCMRYEDTLRKETPCP